MSKYLKDGKREETAKNPKHQINYTNRKMKKIWVVYREYTDWDEYQKDNIKAFTTEAQAEVWCETANILHERWCKITNKVKSKRRREDNLIELLTESEDITAIERLCSMMPEYSKRYGVDQRYGYCVESVKMETP